MTLKLISTAQRVREVQAARGGDGQDRQPHLRPRRQARQGGERPPAPAQRRRRSKGEGAELAGQNARNLEAAYEIQGDRSPRGLSLVGTFVKCFVCWWAVAAVALLPSLITGTSYFDGNKTKLRSLRCSATL